MLHILLEIRRISELGCGLMWEPDKIQPQHHQGDGHLRCGLMWEPDKIQRLVRIKCLTYSCGLMWEPDKIQHIESIIADLQVVV